MRRTIVPVLLVLALILSGPGGMLAADGSAASGEIRIEVDGIWLEPDVAPLIENGRTLVPFAVLLRALGAHVDWQADTRTVVAVRDMVEIRLRVDSKEAVINEPQTGERTVTMDVPARIIRGRTMVPLRFLAENLGAAVHWNAEERTVTVDSRREPPVLRTIDFEVIPIRDMDRYPDLRRSWYDEQHERYGIHSLQTDDWIYILAGGGERPTGGYVMTVRAVTERREGMAHVAAHLSVPGPHEQVTQALTYPHVLIRIPAEGVMTVGGEIREEIRREEPETAQLSLELYFMRDTTTAFVAQAETRTFDGPTVGAGELIEALLAGPESPELLSVIPEGTVLLDVYLDDGILHVDFSGAIREGPWGAETEGVLVETIVRTLMQLDRVEAVQILVDGAVIESIGGHVQIDEPLK